LAHDTIRTLGARGIAALLLNRSERAQSFDGHDLRKTPKRGTKAVRSEGSHFERIGSALVRSALRDQAGSVIEEARTAFKNTTVGDAYPVGADEETCQFIRYWFDGYARRQLTSLSLAIGSLKCETVRSALWCAFSRLIISKQAGASRAKDLSHSRPHRAFDNAPKKPFNKFLSAVERVVTNAVDKNHRDRGPEPTINMGNARALSLPDQSVDLVLTSPPYLNAIDYVRCSKFSLVWMGHKISDLRRIRADSIGTEATRQLATDDGQVRQIVAALRLRPMLEKRNEGILVRYIHDMRKAIFEVGRVLSARGRAVYVIGENTLRGTYIRTSVIIEKLAESAGLSPSDRKTRTLPTNRRYLPPPSVGNLGGAIEARMRREVILSFEK
jgi:hypothetical protein